MEKLQKGGGKMCALMQRGRGRWGETVESRGRRCRAPVIYSEGGSKGSNICRNVGQRLLSGQ